MASTQLLFLAIQKHLNQVLKRGNMGSEFINKQQLQIYN